MTSQLFRCGLVLGSCALLMSCGTGQLACKRDPITGSEQCQETSGSYGEAAVAAGAATGGWAAVGCTVNGCTMPYRCNTKTKQCEPIRCAEGHSCPPAYTCNMDKNRCE